jgi:hypothetical protein
MNDFLAKVIDDCVQVGADSAAVATTGSTFRASPRYGQSWTSSRTLTISFATRAASSLVRKSSFADSTTSSSCFFGHEEAVLENLTSTGAPTLASCHSRRFCLLCFVFCGRRFAQLTLFAVSAPKQAQSKGDTLSRVKGDFIWGGDQQLSACSTSTRCHGSKPYRRKVPRRQSPLPVAIRTIADAGPTEAVHVAPGELPSMPMVGSWHFFAGLNRAERGSSAQVLQKSIFSAISIASSISMPRYRTVLSILV